MIAGLLLAAGGARRFGSQKLIAPLHGIPLVRHAADALAETVNALVIVVGADAAMVRRALDGVNTTIVENAAWSSGLASSVACGVAALPPLTDAVVIALGDEPGLEPSLVRGVIAEWRERRVPAVAVRRGGMRGHPVLFDRAVFSDLLQLHGDRGAAPLLDRLGGGVAYLDAAGPPARDVDTPDDLRALEDDRKGSAI